MTVASAFEKEKKYGRGGGHAVLCYYYYIIYIIQKNLYKGNRSKLYIIYNNILIIIIGFILALSECL